MRWSSVFTYFSIAALVGAVISQLFGWTDGRGWFLMAWTLLLLPVAIGLFGHPMRTPALGLFVGFWGVVAVVFLIVLQALAVADVLRAPAAGQWTAWPLAVVGIWILTASGLGFGAEPFPAWVDLLGLLAGAGLIAIAATTLSGNAELTRDVGVVAAIVYCLWAAGLGWVYWSMQRASHRFRGVGSVGAANHAPAERT